jgi:shikimate kinase
MSKESIVLIGMAGAGKSTIGQALAAKLEFNFLDLDIFIAAQQDATIQSIIDRRGEDLLLELEEKCLREIDLHHMVVAPGGSIIYRPALMEFLKQKTILVFLNVPFETIQKRLKNADTRGIVGYPTKSLREIYRERYPMYWHYADFTINSRNRTPDEIAAEIIDLVSDKIYP